LKTKGPKNHACLETDKEKKRKEKKERMGEVGGGVSQSRKKSNKVRYASCCCCSLPLTACLVNILALDSPAKEDWTKDGLGNKK
jgi:hypothetical protein